MNAGNGRRRAIWLAALGSLVGLGLLTLRLSSGPPPSGSEPPPSQPAPASAPSAAAAGPDDAIRSSRPKAKIPVPRLPRAFATRGPDDLVTVCQQVEKEVVQAGVTPAFASGVTTLLAGALGGRPGVEISPVALYYFIIREAGLGHDKATAARALVASHLDQSIRHYSSLPARERGP
jgi:hypothetical protein